MDEYYIIISQAWDERFKTFSKATVDEYKPLVQETEVDILYVTETGIFIWDSVRNNWDNLELNND